MYDKDVQTDIVWVKPVCMFLTQLGQLCQLSITTQVYLVYTDPRDERNNKQALIIAAKSKLTNKILRFTYCNKCNT